MTLLGLPLGTLLAVGGAVAAVTVALYVLKLRRRPVPVPFSRLWERVLRDREATTLFSALKRLLSLLVQLALVALLVFALGDPRPVRRVEEGRSVVVLVDTSASMKATDVAPSRLDAARERVAGMVRALGGADRMAIVRLDASVRPLGALTGDVPALEAALEELRPSDTRAELRQGLRLALDALRDEPRPELVLVSDGALGDVARAASGLDLGAVTLSFVPVGAASDNVAISAFSVRRYPLDKSRYEVMLELTNLSAAPAEVELSLLGDGAVVEVTRLRVDAGERHPRFLRDLAGASRTLEAAIRRVDGGADHLPADDRAFALLPERRRARVCAVTRGNNYLEAALLLDEYLDVTVVAPARYPPPGTFDVTIFDGVAPPLAPGGGGALYLGVPESGGPLKRGKALAMVGFDQWDEKSPLTRFLHGFGDVQVARAHALVPAKGDRVVAASAQGPLLVAGRRDGRRFVALGFDPNDSDLVLRPAWPLFLLNVVDDFVEEDTSYVSSFRTGDVWRIPVPGDARSATLLSPDGTRATVPVQDGRAIVRGEAAGFHELTVGEGGAPVRFAANLIDLDESRIEPAKELNLGGSPAPPPAPFEAGVRRELWLLLVLVAVALTVIEWITYHRRLTV
ncbi:MAG: VWA domain-containing protein [Polyangiaceae bacterium]|nr:VWA domain-containing protein [Polyangiaceae bacterium]